MLDNYFTSAHTLVLYRQEWTSCTARPESRAMVVGYEYRTAIVLLFKQYSGGTVQAMRFV